MHTYADYLSAPDPDHRGAYLHHVLGLLRSLGPDISVLDAGCGGGLFSLGLHEAGLRVYGCDLNKSGVEFARLRGIGRFETNSLYEDLTKPFEVEQFSAIVSIEVIEHLYSPATFVRRAHDALAPGGILIITTPYWGYFKNLVLAVTNRTDRALTALWEGGHIKHFSRATLSRLIKSVGFEELAFIGCGTGLRGVPYLWSGMLMAFRKPVL